VGGIVASEASRKNFEIPNNIIKRLIGKKITFVTFGGAMAPPAPPAGSATECFTLLQKAVIIYVMVGIVNK
jgi:hypothetical protein